MNVINCDSLFGLQKLSVSTLVVPVTANSCPCQYVLVNIKPNVRLICQLCSNRDINPNYCVLSKNTVKIDAAVTSMVLCGSIVHDLDDYKVLRFQDLTFLEQIGIVENIRVTVVFDNAYLTSKWRTKVDILRCLLKGALKLFVVSDSVILFPQCVTLCRNFGVYCIFVHSVDCNYGRIVGSTMLHIDSIISKNLFQSDKMVPSIGGVNTVYEKLKEYCMLESNRISSRFSMQFSNNVSIDTGFFNQSVPIKSTTICNN